mmetsp:Transcript_45998/g.77334  ORF Transcript_45998/g.77334 Transcript_45998/m.77334 type:complete len:227 (-) Transcript_45998:2310-2990(-)
MIQGPRSFFYDSPNKTVKLKVRQTEKAPNHPQLLSSRTSGSFLGPTDHTFGGLPLKALPHLHSHRVMRKGSEVEVPGAGACIQGGCVPSLRMGRWGIPVLYIVTLLLKQRSMNVGNGSGAQGARTGGGTPPLVAGRPPVKIRRAKGYRLRPSEKPPEPGSMQQPVNGPVGLYPQHVPPCHTHPLHARGPAQSKTWTVAQRSVSPSAHHPLQPNSPSTPKTLSREAA